jgi:hypothetical protein
LGKTIIHIIAFIEKQHMRLHIIIFLLTVSFQGLGQNDFVRDEEKLAFYADVMVNASKASHRIQAGDRFNELFLEVLTKPNSFEYPFDSLEWISKQQPSDSTFRIFTWYLASEGQFKYYGFFQTKDSQLIMLEDNLQYHPEIIYDITGPSNWYGQIYYDLKEYVKAGKNSYLLFGARVRDINTNQKMATPLTWNGTELKFGEELFFKNSRHGATRLLIEYFSRSKASLKFDEELNLVIFDHIVPVVNPYESNDVLLVPEGTFEGFKFENGRWQYEEKIFKEHYDTAPVPEPILKNNDKDLFGR